jgi:hypothetical protein
MVMVHGISIQKYSEMYLIQHAYILPDIQSILLLRVNLEVTDGLDLISSGAVFD